jgi:Rrf2 family protein
MNLVLLMASWGEGAFTARQLGAELGLSLSYMEGLLRPLREAGLVRACRGPGGGYALALLPQDISLWQVVCALSDEGAEPEAGRPAGSNSLCPGEQWPAQLERRYLQHAQQFLAQRFVGQWVAPGQAPQQPLKPRSRFGLKPLAPRLLPQAPNSVFQLSQFAHSLPA